MAKRELNYENLPSNNQTVSNRKPKAEPVLEPGRVTTRGQKGGLAYEIRNITNSLFTDIVLPALKNGVVDFLNTGVQMLVLGKGSFRPNNYTQHTGYHVPYQITNQPTYKKIAFNQPKTSGQLYEPLFFETRRECEHVLHLMRSQVSEYGFVSLADLYSMVGMDNNFTMQDWGWTNLDHVGVVHTRGGYIIDLPQPVFRRG